MRNMLQSIFMLGALVVLVGACSANGSEVIAPASGGAGGNQVDGSAGAFTGGTGGTGGVLNTDSGIETGTPPTIAHLQGQVLAPEGTIPISGALVYLTTTVPPSIPEHVFCDKCVQIALGEDYTFTHPDGTFNLPASSTGSQFLVVQKGQFRKVRTINVVPGDQHVDPEFTRLPGRMNKANGEDIPKMAVIVGQWDAIEVSLAKLGLADIIPSALGGKVDRSTAGFDMIENTWPPDLQDPMKNPSKFLKSWDYLSRYHILFIPCSGSDGTTCNDYLPDDSTVQQNLQRFVSEGGKLYVTDYSYEYVRRPWPGYVTWDTETSSTGSACLTGDYNAPAAVQDQDMKDWLAAQGINNFDVEANWTRIDSLHTQPGFDADGVPADITPKAWVLGGSNPATISFEDHCGRVLFSTYHTEGNADDHTLLPQERALLYVLLEVGVCVGTPLPPK